MVRYRTLTVDGLDIFYREAGPADAPVLLLLHGFPSSSRMYEPLLRRLGGRWRLIAPDYPGFGHSSAPAPADFAYTFDHLAEVMNRFVDALGIDRYVLYMQDYGGPVGFRMAMARPECLDALVVQNAVAHDNGLGPLWQARRAFWAHRAANEPALRENFLSLAATRARHLGSDPAIDRYDPDLWTDEYAFLTRPGQAEIQLELFYDYRTNVAAYPVWQRWLREHRPRTLVLWGRYDESFQVQEADNYRADLPDAQVHLLDGGHFVLDTCADEAAERIRAFLDKH
jgi:pimeloyl-ACP methyl ester carboxylesterase